MSFASGLDYELEVGGSSYHLLWVALDDVPIDRVRALAFAGDRRMLLVKGGSGFQFPGGGVESLESPIQALKRELWEEARGRVLDSERLGTYRIEHSDGQVEFHDYYWCRILLEDGWMASEEISERILVDQNRLVETLQWGPDPKVSLLLEKALAAELKREDFDVTRTARKSIH